MTFEPTPRRFALMDGMILVAATGVGLAWNRVSYPDFSTYNYPWLRKWPTLTPFNLAIWVLVPNFAVWTLTLVLLGLRRPRPSLSEVVRGPGMAGCLAASLAILYEAAWYIPFKWGHPNGVRPGILILHTVDKVGVAVGGIWLVLAISLLWSAERHWIDRTGRCLGICWIAITIALDFRNLIL